jgi:signal transduction histidine kinase
MSKKPARHGRAQSSPSRPLSVSGWPLRRKVALALMIPLILAATFGALRVRSDLIDAEDSSSSAKQVTVLRPAVDYLTAAERAMVASYNNDDAALESALRDVKAAGTDLQGVSSSADLTPAQQRQVAVIMDLSRVLREPEANVLGPGAWIAQLRQLQSGVTQLITTIVNAQIDPEPRLEQLSQALAGRFSLAAQQALVATGIAGSGPDALELYRELGSETTAIDRLATALGDSTPQVADLRTGNTERSNAVRLSKDESVGTADFGGPQAYAPYDSLINDFLDGIDQQLDENASAARTSALVNAGITLAALLAAIILALIVSRLLLNPIRRVREGALAVANRELPEEVATIQAGGDPGPIQPIDVTTKEEIGQLARAVDDLHREAVLLASREAKLKAQVGDMFVTLSRRHNSLINQQLGLIESLEKDEEDSRRLESLFRLDHLAARMRRTSESLLVLADAPPTRAASTDELTVSAALEAASAAVQDYKRVRVGSADNIKIKDTAAADIVHLLTELVDNALSYSSPATSVSLSSATTAEGVTLEIADAGIGMSADSLDDLNEILHSGGEITPDTARRMGLFVVSRLAKRHGIAVSLLRNHQRGITARVMLPTSVLDKGLPDDPRKRSSEAQSMNRMVPEQRHPSTAPDRLGLDLPGSMNDLPSRSVSSGASEQAPVVPVPDGAARAGSIEEPTQEDGDASTPIFRAMRSAWLNAGGDAPWLSTEVESGWDRADEVARSLADTQLSAAGLPVRRPGNRLVPGGVTKSSITSSRDPEEIRARLAAHAEGVSRGRTATRNDQSPTEAGH